MFMKKHKLTAWLAAAAAGLSMLGGTLPQAAVTASAAGNCQMEYLDRGISAINTGSGIHVQHTLEHDATLVDPQHVALLL